MAWGKSAAHGVDDWCKKLASNDPSLTHLTVLKHRKFDCVEVSKFSAALKGNTHLTELNASCHEISPEAAAVLGAALAHCQLSSLCIGTSTFGDAGLAALSTGIKGGAVEVLDLENKGLTEVGAKVCADILGSSRHLQRLILSRNPMGDAGAEALGSCCWSAPLHHLDMRACGLSAKGLSLLTATLSAVPGGLAPLAQLQTLVLSDNQLGHSEGSALTKLLAATPQLLELNLSSTDLGSAAVAELAAALPAHHTLRLLDLSSVGVDDVAGLALAAALPQSSSLATLLLAGNPLISPPVLIQLSEAIGRSPQIVSLDLAGSKVDVACVSVLSDISQLTHLSLMGCSLGEGGAQALSAAFAAGRCKVLKELCVSGCGLSLSALVALFDALKAGGAGQLQELECGANPGCDDDALEELVNVLRSERSTLHVHWTSADTRGAA